MFATVRIIVFIASACAGFTYPDMQFGVPSQVVAADVQSEILR
jgi:hypothetical protein